MSSTRDVRVRMAADGSVGVDLSTDAPGAWIQVGALAAGVEAAVYLRRVPFGDATVGKAAPLAPDVEQRLRECMRRSETPWPGDARALLEAYDALLDAGETGGGQA